MGGGLLNIRESIANSERFSKQQSPDGSPYKDFARANVNRSNRTRQKLEFISNNPYDLTHLVAQTNR